MTAAIERFDKFLQLSDKIPARADREDVEQRARVPVELCAHYHSRFGEIPMPEMLEAFDSETMSRPTRSGWPEDEESPGQRDPGISDSSTFFGLQSRRLAP
ncbi:MAG: hypothetical protein ABI728_11835 [Betaproteobacteria bacterium]